MLTRSPMVPAWLVPLLTMKSMMLWSDWPSSTRGGAYDVASPSRDARRLALSRTRPGSRCAAVKTGRGLWAGVREGAAAGAGSGAAAGAGAGARARARMAVAVVVESDRSIGSGSACCSCRRLLLASGSGTGDDGRAWPSLASLSLTCSASRGRRGFVDEAATRSRRDRDAPPERGSAYTQAALVSHGFFVERAPPFADLTERLYSP
jgi:hypothetical protein